MRVLHFGSNYLPNKGGNVVRMTKMLEDNKSGDELFVLTTAQKGDFDDEQYYYDKKIKIFRINTIKDAYKILPIIVKENHIDVVVTHIIPANIIACRTLPKSVIIMTEIHSLIDSGRLKNTLKGLLHRFYLNKRTKKYFVLSKGASNYIIKNYGVKKENIVFLPNGYTGGNEKHSVSNNTKYFTFGYVGTFYKWQGINVIADNLDKILSINEKIRIYLVGGGELEQELKEKAKNSNGRLVCTGLVDKKDIKKHMQEIDVLMIPRPSTLETETAIPLKIFDSIESGKPVIISNVYGLIEVLGDKQAFVYDKKHFEGLYKTCEFVFNNKDICEEKFNESVKKLKEWPSWEEIHKRQHEVFKNEKNI